MSNFTRALTRPDTAHVAALRDRARNGELLTLPERALLRPVQSMSVR